MALNGQAILKTIKVCWNTSMFNLSTLAVTRRGIPGSYFLSQICEWDVCSFNNETDALLFFMLIHRKTYMELLTNFLIHFYTPFLLNGSNSYISAQGLQN